MPAEKREAAQHLIEQEQCSISKACKLVQLPRSTYQYNCKQKDDSAVQNALTELTSKHPTIGFWQCHHRLRNRGERWNHKRVRRVYRQMKLNIRRRAKKRLPERVKQPLTVPTAPNQMWSIDFCTTAIQKVDIDAFAIRFFNSVSLSSNLSNRFRRFFSCNVLFFLLTCS